MLRVQIQFFALLLLLTTFSFAQVPKTVPAKREGSGVARGTLAADMDCTVRLNGSPKLLNLKAYTPLVVNLKTGDNNVEATSTDKKSNVKKTIKGVAGDTTLVEISFFDDSRFLEYVKQGNMPMIETAIKKNPDLITNKGGSLVTTPLEIAIINSQPEVVTYFLDKGASFTKPQKIYPLHKSIMFASPVKSIKRRKPAADSVLVELFLSKGCDIDEKDEVGNTPLHCAAQYGKADLVAILVERGADINAKNTFGDTPLKLAENKGYVTIIDYLKSKGALEK
ncbi:MAG TPA: ankyrin repeat domain-containing protein [Bacteroidia bacterium]|jgi:hypothetical protein|nr:ankyrin repeat domain-containing protein [Bacteroidia bacterium]